ncbi:MAG TPA: universal stress protein [Rhodospirillales bacterium]|nr:universal stress protein [Rhodospirillales bacterium]
MPASPYQHVMAALDESEEWHTVAGRAGDLARRFGARLTLLHVVDQRALAAGGEADVPLFGMDERAGRPSTTDPAPVPSSLDDRLMVQARLFLGTVAERLPDIRAEGVVVASATIAHAIAESARRRDVDLLVCGAHRRHWFGGLFGSPADGVVHEMPCDLLLVRLP